MEEWYYNGLIFRYSTSSGEEDVSRRDACSFGGEA